MSKLFVKLAKIQAQLKSIPETGRNSFHGYNYATAENIINAVRPVCSEHGVFISISCTESQILKDVKAASVTVTLTLTDCETGESTFAQCPGYAEDAKSDKSLWKAITGASKYVIRSFFCLATTDDPEQEDDQVRPSSNPSVTNSQPTKPVAVNTAQPSASTTVNQTVNSLHPVPSEPATNKPVTNNGVSTTALIDQTAVEMARAGWTTAEGRLFLEQTFSKRTRKDLTASELHQFLSHLRSLPSAPPRAPAGTAT